MQPTRPRPLGATLFGVLMVMAGIFNLAPWFSLNYSDQSQRELVLQGFFLGAVLLVTGVGFLKGWGSRASWTLGLLLAFFNFVWALAYGTQAVVTLGIVIMITVVYCILTPSVRNYSAEAEPLT